MERTKGSKTEKGPDDKAKGKSGSEASKVVGSGTTDLNPKKKDKKSKNDEDKPVEKAPASGVVSEDEATSKSKKASKDPEPSNNNKKEKSAKVKKTSENGTNGNEAADQGQTGGDKPDAISSPEAAPSSTSMESSVATKRKRPKSVILNPSDLPVIDSGASNEPTTPKSASKPRSFVVSPATPSDPKGLTVDDTLISPSKLKGPSRENSRTDVTGRSPSPINQRRKSAGHVGRHSQVNSATTSSPKRKVDKKDSNKEVDSASGGIAQQSDQSRFLISDSGKGSGFSDDNPNSNTNNAGSNNNNANGTSNTAGTDFSKNGEPHQQNGSHDGKSSSQSNTIVHVTTLEVPSLESTPRQHSDSISSTISAGTATGDGSINAQDAYSNSKLGDLATKGRYQSTGKLAAMRQMFEPPPDAVSSNPKPPSTKKALVPSTSSSSIGAPPVVFEEKDEASSTTDSIPGSTAVVRQKSGSNVRRSSPKTVKKTASGDPVKISVDRDEYRKLREDASHYRRGYDLYKTKYLDLKEQTLSEVNSTSSAVDLNQQEVIDDMKRQIRSLMMQLQTVQDLQTNMSLRSSDLTASMEALALKFRLTMENVGLRMDSMEAQIKALQAGTATRLSLGTIISGSDQSNDSHSPHAEGGLSTPTGRNSRGSLSLETSPMTNEASSKLKRGNSQKEVTSKRSSILLQPGNSKNPSLNSQSSSGTLNANIPQAPPSPTLAQKDSTAFWTPFLIDFNTLKRKTVVPLLQQSNQEILDKRTRVAIEILDSEQKYILGLEILINNWVKPLEAYAAAETKIPLNELKTIFGDGWLTYMLQNNVTHLCDKLEQKLINWNEVSTTLGDVFVDFSPYLQPYKRYCARYEECLNLLATLTESNHKFKKSLEFFDNHGIAYNGLKLRDYLITPVQRIPRYAMLLKDLLKSTPEFHPDRPLLETAIGKVSAVADDLNEGIRQAESQLKMKALTERGYGFEMLARGNSHRSHTKSTPVDVLVDLTDRKKGAQNKKFLELLLFNDVIVAGNFVNKKALPQEYSIPIALTWISTDLTESPEDLNPLLEGCPRNQSFLIRGPESLWLVGIRKLSDFSSWLESLSTAIGHEQASLSNGPRKGRYDFLKLPGSYDGEWLDGDFHGYGVYVKTDGTLFDGHWDARFKAGFGEVTQGGAGQQLTGWKNPRPDDDIIVYRDHAFWDARQDLNDRDWAILLTGAKEVQYKKDQKVVEQGLPNEKLFKIKTGKCRVEKDTPEGRRVLTTMTAGFHFGDTSVLPMMQTATADVICDSVTADIYVIEVSILFEILKTNPALAMRFFKQLAKTLASRLKLLHQAPPKVEKHKTNPTNSPTTGHSVSPSPLLHTHSSKFSLDAVTEKDDDAVAQSQDSLYCAKFDLPPGEVIIKEVEAALRGVVKKFGKLYLSRKFMCFEATVFGLSSKEVIPLDRITKVEMVKKSLHVTTKSKKMDFRTESVEEFYALLSSVVTNAASSTSSNPHEPSGSTSKKDADKSDDNVTASSEDSKGGPGPKRRSTTLNLSVADDSETGSLTRNDWNLLQQGFKVIKYPKGTPVTEQGATHLRLFQLAKGKCSIQITSATETKVVGQMGSGDLFGELSFLDGSAASASVIAADEVVEVYVIEGHFINILFVKYPELAGRFYAYLAGVIAGRLNQREVANRPKPKKKVSKAVDIKAHPQPHNT